MDLRPYKCRAGKIIYFTDSEARLSLHTTMLLRDRGHARRKERSVYQCPLCHFWHLTSQEQTEKRVSA